MRVTIAITNVTLNGLWSLGFQHGADQSDYAKKFLIVPESNLLFYLYFSYIYIHVTIYRASLGINVRRTLKLYVT